MNKALICLGANTDGKEESLRYAADFLQTVCTIDERSEPFLSDPERSAAGPLYLNEVIAVLTESDYDTFAATLKAYETAVRRNSAATGLVAIDIDVVVWNGRVLRPVDYKSDYFARGLGRLKPCQ